jgi:hypothetical protein
VARQVITAMIFDYKITSEELVMQKSLESYNVMWSRIMVKWCLLYLKE